MARYALVIGIAEYKSKHLANLSKPVQDADAIATLLHKYGQCDKEPTVLKGKVTTQQLVEALQTFLTKQAVNSEAIIYFTGHGISVKEPLGPSQGYLTTSDCEVSLGSDRKPIGQQNAISFASLNSLIQGANLSSLVMLIDACHSGDFIEQAAVEQSFSAFSTKQDHLLLTACRDFESAFAKKSDDHSLFTGAVLDALVPEKADADGIITGDSLFASLSRTLKGSSQEPVRFGKGRSLRIVQFPADLLPEPTSSAKDRAARQLRVPRVPLQMPPLPDHFVERPKYQQAVKELLLCEGTKVGTLVVSAIYGLGGIGKSVLASKLAHDEEIQTRFCDGILWSTLGQSPDILPLLSDWIQALGDYDYKPTSIEGASNQLRTLLHDKRVLLVVDDVWNPEHLENFRVGGEGCCVLVTTREAKIPSAHRYNLDVMDADQALELMTQKLSGRLNETNRQWALAFAERVGYLPLALELAVSQIEEGVTWSELLADLKDEVVRLETLDTYGQEEIPDDAKRRKYSLLACFNLSLKQLSIDQLRQFAWLGVLPEDVSLTQEMAETLWQVTSRQARAILRTFKAKTLLLQGVQQTYEKSSYRMHDLMHDLAERLLMSPSQPVQEDELPGMGLTKAKAHTELLKRYRTKTQNGQWHTLKDDGYIYAHLTWHMEQAEQPQEIHQLLRMSNEQGHNGWYKACDVLGKTAGFVNDLGRAWQLTVNHYEQDPSESVTLLFRYALIRTSLNSLVSNLPEKLVGALVKQGIWQFSQGLAYAQQAQDPWHRAKCISAIIPYMPKALLPEVLRTIGQINDAAYSSYVLSKLVERFPKVWPDVLATIQQIRDRSGYLRWENKGFPYRALALSQIAAQLPSKYLSKAIDITYQIRDISDQVMALTEIAKRFTEVCPKTLDLACQLQGEWPRAWALHGLIESLPRGLRLEALKTARQIQNKELRSLVLSKLAEYFPGLWSEALEALRQIQDGQSQAHALSRLIKQLPTELWLEALDITRQIESMFHRALLLYKLAENSPELWLEALDITHQIQPEYDRSTALSKLVDLLPAELMPQALEIADQIRDREARPWGLCAMAKYLPELWPEVLESIGYISESSRSIALKSLAPHLSPKLLPEALKVTNQIRSDYYRLEALNAFAEYLPVKLLLEVLNTTRKIQDESNYFWALYALAEDHMPELWLEALEVVNQIQDESAHFWAIHALAKDHQSELWPEALEVARQIQDEQFRANALSELVKYAHPEILPQVLEVIGQIQDIFLRSSVLISLAEYLPVELLPKVLKITCQIQDEYSQSRTLFALAKQHPDLLPKVLEVTRRIQNPESRTRALSVLAENRLELWPEALEAVRQVPNDTSRSNALSELLKYAPPDLLSELLEIAYQIQDEDSRSSALSNLVERWCEQWPEALEVTRQIENEIFRSRALRALVKQWPELWPEVLKITGQIQEDEDKSIALCAMTPFLSLELWPETLEMANGIQDESEKSNTLCTIAEYLPKEQWLQLLRIICQIQDESYLSSTLNGLVKYLPSELRQTALDIIWQFKDKYYCANTLHTFLPSIDEFSISFDDWEKVINMLAYKNRRHFLSVIPHARPIIIQLGDKKAFSDTLQAAREVCQQWP